MRQRLRYVWLIVFGILAAAPAHASNIVLNPDFESGLEPWFVSGSDGTASWNRFVAGANSPGLYHSGSASIGVGCVSIGGYFDCSLSQLLPTTAGTVYDLSFWVAEAVFNYPETATAANALRVIWNNGASVTTLNQPADRTCTEITQNNWDCLWVQHTITGLVATGEASQLQFLGFDNPGILFLDDVVVTAQLEDLPETSEVPEPATVALLGAGLLGIATGVRRRRRR